ncbi:hypothetical protein [Galenea microaerophila]
MKRTALVWLFILPFIMLSSGCSKEKVQITSAAIVNQDRGSGNFDRVLEICFEKPLSATYYHKVFIVTYEDVKIRGEGRLTPLASDPDNKCIYKNLYFYINRNSPVGMRQMIHDYVRPGNIRLLKIQVFADKPEGKAQPMDEKTFRDL